MSSVPAAERGPRRFRPQLLPTLLTLLVLAVLIGLGTWQMQRLAWKEALTATIETRLGGPPAPLAELLAEPPAADFRRVRLTGHYLHDRAFAFGTFARGGEFGARLVTPLRMPAGAVLLVDRGWLPEALLPPERPAELLPAGEVTLTAVLRFRGDERALPFTPDNRPVERRWFWWDLPAMAAAVGDDLLPVVAVLDAPDGPGPLPRVEPVRFELANNHLGYAMTWYGLALGLLAVYVALSLQPREP